MNLGVYRLKTFHFPFSQYPEIFFSCSHSIALFQSSESCFKIRDTFSFYHSMVSYTGTWNEKKKFINKNSFVCKCCRPLALLQERIFDVRCLMLSLLLYVIYLLISRQLFILLSFLQFGWNYCATITMLPGSVCMCGTYSEQIFHQIFF